MQYFCIVFIPLDENFSAKEGTKLGKVLEADDHTKIEIKFTVREAKSNDAVTVHQAFVAFVNQETAQEIIYVATADSSNTYIFDMAIFYFFFLVNLMSLNIICVDNISLKRKL